jgi:hypothetical protein
MPVATPPKAWVCDRSLSGIAGSNAAGGNGCLSVVSFECRQVEVSATGLSLVQRGPTECDLRTSQMRKPRSTEGCRAKKNTVIISVRQLLSEMWRKIICSMD